MEIKHICKVCGNNKFIEYDGDEFKNYNSAVKCSACGFVDLLDIDECKQNVQEHTQIKIDSSKNIPKCPICGSTSLSKITSTKKAIKIAAFGIFGMGDNGKTYKCNSCGSKF